MDIKYEIKKTIKTRFIAGILVIVPLFVAIAVLKFVIESIDNFLGPYLFKLVGKHIDFPLMGLAVTLALIILTGILTTNVFGQRIFNFWETLLMKIPYFNTIYSAARQVVEGFAVPEKRSFERVVLVEYPRKGIFAMGLLANRITIISSEAKREFVSIFIPNTPTPFTGIAILYPESEVTYLDITIEEALKFIVSGSVSSPKIMNTIAAGKLLADNERESSEIDQGLET